MNFCPLPQGQASLRPTLPQVEGSSALRAAELLAPCEGERTEAGMRTNIRVALQYLEAWINGNGCVPIYGLMEDAATAEISRAQVWQWVRHNQKLDDGRAITKELVRQIVREDPLVWFECYPKIENKALIMGFTSGSLSGGDSTLTVRVLYTLIDGAP